MSTIISSPGVQINELDLTSNARQTAGISVAVVGYSNEGPVYEPTFISSTSELDNTFGTPTNAAERYMYHSIRQVLSRSLAQVLAVRLPYDTTNAIDTRSALAYPVSASNIGEFWGVDRTPDYTSYEDLLNDSVEYDILPPISFQLTQSQYEDEILQKNFSWSRSINIPKYGDSTNDGKVLVYPTAIGTAVNPMNTSTTAPGFIGCAYSTDSLSSTNRKASIEIFTGAAIRPVVDVSASLNGYQAGINMVEVDDVTGLRVGLHVSVDAAGVSHLPANTFITSIDTVTNALTLSQDFTDNWDPAVTSLITFKLGEGATALTTNRYVSLGNSGNSTFGNSGNSIKYKIVEVTGGTIKLALNGKLSDFVSVGTVDVQRVGDGRRIVPVFPVGMFVVDTDQGIQTNLFEGTYIGITDNSSVGLDSGYSSIVGIKALNGVLDSSDSYVGTPSTISLDLTAPPYVGWGVDPVGGAWTNSLLNYDFYTTWSTVPSERIDFKLTSNYTVGSSLLSVSNSISETIEKLPGYPIHTDEYKDTVIVSAFKLRRSIYSLSTDVLASSFVGGYVGSLYSLKKQNSPSGGPAGSFFIEDVANSANNSLVIQVNPYISNSSKWISATSTTTSTGIVPDKAVRVHPDAKNLYAVGSYSVNDQTSKKLIGNLPSKLDKALKLLEDSSTYPVDIIIDAGLSTIWPTTFYKHIDVFTESGIDGFSRVASFSDEDGFPENYITSIGTKTIDTTNSTAVSAVANMVNPHQIIHEYFTTFAGENRKDLIYIADPLKQVFIKGRDYKVEDKEDFNFSSQVFWPLYHLFEPVRSSYVATYANWAKVGDASTARSVWIPISGAIAGTIMAAEQNTFPWTAVAGFNRGTINGLLDVAVSPSQRDRDLLYKISMNPVANFMNDGIVIFGQKTMFTKPSAFDRVNVRRLFIALEKYTARAVKYFVFEPNTYFTRSRLVSTLRPLFDSARQNDGLYDYRIVCDERNNTPDIIDNNQLKVDIYIKPTRTAEFILVNFFATRTDQNFDEILPL